MDQKISFIFQSSPNYGFSDNDHAIRGLMRFIEMTSKKFRVEVVIRNGEAPSYKCYDFKLKGGLNSFIF